MVMLCQEDAQASCCARDGGRSSGVALQEVASNSHELLRPKAAVVNVMEKAWHRLRHVWVRETSASEPLMKHRKALMTPKPGLHDCPGINMEDSCLLTMWRPVYRRRDPDPGFCTELETLFGDVKGKGTSGDPTRLKVPMRRAGSDCSIVAMKRGNARGAKGVGHRRWMESTGNRRNSIFWRKAAAFVRWHEPDESRGSSPESVRGSG
jgi:hypothetical protein